MTTMIVKGIHEMQNVPDTVQRVVVLGNGQGKPPPGWREAAGARHVGNGRWMVPYERTEA